MVSRAQVKYIRSLQQKKHRLQAGHYVVEGDKMCREWLLARHPVEWLVATAGWLQENEKLFGALPESSILEASGQELSTLSGMQTPNQVMLCVPVCQAHAAAEKPSSGHWRLMLDAIRDPGNLGTMLRIADWFGLPEVIASYDSADFYNPKVVQSAMGAHLRVKLTAADLPHFLQQQSCTILAATLGGTNIYTLAQKPHGGILIIGNESAGVSEEVLEYATQQASIPGYGGAESLNASVAAGILCAALMGH